MSGLSCSFLSEVLIVALSALSASQAESAPQAPPGIDRPTALHRGALAGHRHRVLISTDIGGTDPDDYQSMVHLLVYADVFDIEGLISSPYGPGRKRHILDVIDCYAKDYANLKTYSEKYPSPGSLRALSKQGETERAPYAGYRRSTEGSDWIVHCARRNDPRPLYVLVWGGLEDLAQALHDAPDILPKLRVYWIGGPNKKWSPDAFQYIAKRFSKLWMIESNASYRGWFVGGDQSGDWGNESFVSRHIAGKGALGDFFVSRKSDIKMGDTPSVGWLLQGTPLDPSQPGWGGQFVRAPERPFRQFQRLTTRKDRIEAFSILELALPIGADTPKKPEAWLLVENQSLVGHVTSERTMRFRFCPKAAKRYSFRIRSNLPNLDGKKGEVTAVTPEESSARPAVKKYPNWWTDDRKPELAEGAHIGAKSVNRWRVDFLRDFAARMRRCESPKP